MGVDAKFYFRPSVTAEEIMTALKALGYEEVHWTATSSPRYVNINFKSDLIGWDYRSMHFFYNSDDFSGMPCNSLSLRTNEESIEIFHKLAKMIGGVVQDRDSDDACVYYRVPGHGNLRWLIEQYYLHNAETPSSSDDDIKAFVKWKKRRL